MLRKSILLEETGKGYFTLLNKSLDIYKLLKCINVQFMDETFNLSLFLIHKNLIFTLILLRQGYMETNSLESLEVTVTYSLWKIRFHCQTSRNQSKNNSAHSANVTCTPRNLPFSPLLFVTSPWESYTCSYLSYTLINVKSLNLTLRDILLHQ